MENRKKNIWIIILAILLLGLTGYLIYDRVFSSGNLSTKFNTKAEQAFIDSKKYSKLEIIDDYYNNHWEYQEVFGNEMIDGKRTISEGSYVPNSRAVTHCVTEDGSLYELDSTDNFVKVNVQYKAKKIVMFNNPFVDEELCNQSVELVDIIIESTDGNKYVMTYNSSTNKYEYNRKYEDYFSDEYIIYSIPECYSNKLNHENYLSRIFVYNNGYIGFASELYDAQNNYKYDKNKLIKDNNTFIKASYIIYIDTDSGDKYYIISDDNKLYILDKNDNNISYISKVNNVDISNRDKLYLPNVDNVLTLTIENNEKLVFNLSINNDEINDNSEADYQNKLSPIISNSVNLESLAIMHNNYDTNNFFSSVDNRLRFITLIIDSRTFSPGGAQSYNYTSYDAFKTKYEEVYGDNYSFERDFNSDYVLVGYCDDEDFRAKVSAKKEYVCFLKNNGGAQSIKLTKKSEKWLNSKEYQINGIYDIEQGVGELPVSKKFELIYSVDANNQAHIKSFMVKENN